MHYMQGWPSNAFSRIRNVLRSRRYTDCTDILHMCSVMADLGIDTKFSRT